jgi:hypothetical protein
MWYNADATDPSSVHSSESWRATVQAQDDNGLQSPATTTLSGTQLDQLLAYNVSTTSIAYGGLQPGFSTDPFVQTSDLNEWGNTGIDERLYGDRMCTNWTSADSCDAGHDHTNSIPIFYQQVATSSGLNYNATTSVNYLTYGTHALAASTTPYMLHINVLKTTATNTPQTKNTWWGILVPSVITQSGAYSGQNTIIAVTSSTTVWQ